MNKTTFKLKVLTPMFMGGANPENPELRAASIRGAMRFWFRAIAGAITNNPREVYRLESEVFGNTEKKSKVVVRVKKGDKFGHLPNISRISSFTAYLANIGLARPGKGFVRKAIAPDSEIIVEIIESEQLHELSTSIFKIAVALGGFGARWRHGFGSCEVSDSSPIIISELINSAVDKLRLIVEKMRIDITSSQIDASPLLNSFSNRWSVVWEGNILREQKREHISNIFWENALNNIGNKYRSFRTHDGDGYHTKDYIDVISKIFSNTRESIKKDLVNDIFGLPIQYVKTKKEKIGGKSKVRIDKKAIVTLKSDEYPVGRRASPLILHIEPINNFIRATLFKSKFIPENDVEYFIEHKSRKIRIKKPKENLDYKRIEKFVDEFLNLNRRYPDVK